MHPSRHARINDADARHLGELSQREIRVYICLLAHRNERSGRCDPSRKTIVEFTGIRDKGNMSKAIAGLASKGWIKEGPNGFEFPGKVVSSTTNDAEKGCRTNNRKSSVRQPKVVKTTTAHNIAIEQRSEQRSNSANAPAAAAAPSPKPKPKPKATKNKPSRIPDPFPITDEMRTWAAKEVPGVDVDDAHLDFVEYWTNLTTKKAIGLDWLLRWKKGMRLRAKWNERDRAAGHVGKSDVVSFPEPIPAPVERRPPPDNIPAADLDAWDRLRGEIAARLHHEPFQTWFGPVIFDGVDDGRLLLRTDTFSVDWIGQYYAGLVDACKADVGLAHLSIAWEREQEDDARKAARA